jgi:hypothetical protein
MIVLQLATVSSNSHRSVNFNKTCCLLHSQASIIAPILFCAHLGNCTTILSTYINRGNVYLIGSRNINRCTVPMRSNPEPGEAKLEERAKEHVNRQSLRIRLYLLLLLPRLLYRNMCAAQIHSQRQPGKSEREAT